MKITETRKQIIELIEPYMDKTLSEGCIVDVEGDYYTTTKENLNYDFGITTPYFIIGHYDITAVLKYIRASGRVNTGGKVFIFENKIVIEELFSFSSLEIPNKPLHLYTEEEDKQLLDLLLKLK